MIGVSRTHKACKQLIQRTAEFNRTMEARLHFICRIVADEIELPEDCPCSASYAERELEPLLEELREVYATAELIRSVIWQDQQA